MKESNLEVVHGWRGPDMQLHVLVSVTRKLRNLNQLATNIAN